MRPAPLDRVRRRRRSARSHADPLHLVEARFPAPAVTEMRGVHDGMVRHLRYSVQDADVLEMRLGARSLEGVAGRRSMDGSWWGRVVQRGSWRFGFCLRAGLMLNQVVGIISN